MLSFIIGSIFYANYCGIVPIILTICVFCVMILLYRKSEGEIEKHEGESYTFMPVPALSAEWVKMKRRTF